MLRLIGASAISNIDTKILATHYTHGSHEQTKTAEEAGTDEHYNYIRFAENLSARICETCGAPGKRRGQGYIYTACDEHTEKGDLNVNETDLSE